jgi:uncharacterized protein YkwD
LVSTKLCDELARQTCHSQPEKANSKKQIQAAIVTAQPQKIDPQPTVNSQTTQITPLPTMAALNSTYASDSAILNSDLIFDLVNQYRSSLGKAPFEKDAGVCELAATRSNEIIAEIGNGTLHSGLYNRGLPYWIFENAKYGSNEEGTVAWWLASPIHHQSIVADYKYSCVKCTGSYCSELFTSYAPK